MPKPDKPTVPPAALRSDPDTFAERAENTIIFFETLTDFMDETNDWVDEKATQATTAAMVGGLSSLTGMAGRVVAVNSAGDGLVPEMSLRVDEDVVAINNAHVWGDVFTVANDSVATVDMPKDRNGCWLFLFCNAVAANPQTSHNGVLQIDAGTTPLITPVFSGSLLNVTTGALTGTTGLEGYVTVSVEAATGVIQIENRSGFTRTFQAVML